MTVVQPNSIAGINSITVQSGNALNLHKADGTLIRTLVAESGISTYTSISVGSAVTDNSANNSINIGLGASISNASNNVLTFGTNGDDRVTIDASGNSKFISNARQVIIQNGGTSGQPEIAFRNAADDGDAYGNIDGATLDLRTGGTSRLHIDTGGRLLVGNTATVHGHTEKLQITGTDATTAVFLSRYSNNANAAYLHFVKSRNTSIGGNTIVQDDDLLGRIYFQGNDGSGPQPAAYIESYVDGTPGSTDMPGRLSFLTSADGTPTPVERLRITSAGKVLIGHTASEAMFYTGNLQVQGTNSTTSAITVKSNQNDSGGPAIVLGKSRGALGGATVVQDNDELGCIYFNGADGTDTVSRGAAIRCQVDGTPGSNDMPGRLMFMTTADGAAAVTERFRITSAGHIAVKTDDVAFSGSGTLRINSGSTSGALNLDGGATNRGGEINLTGGSNGGRIQFRTGQGSGQQDERMRLDESGKLVVGHTAALIVSAGGVESHNVSGNNFGAGRFVAGSGGPDFWFIKSRNATVGSHTVVQSGDTTGTIQFAGSDGDSYTRTAAIVSSVDGTPGDGDMPGRLEFQTTADGASSPTERMRIKSTGDVLIGRTTTSTSHTLCVQADNNAEAIVICGRSSDDIGELSWYEYDSTTRLGEIQYRTDQCNIRNRSPGSYTALFTTPSGGSLTERLRLTSTGKLLINNTASNTMWGYGQGGLQLTGNWDEASASFLNDEDNTNSHAITLAKIRGSSIVQSGDTVGSVVWNGYDGSAFKPTARIRSVVDGTPGSSDMPGRLVFETVNDGGVTPTERMRITSDGRVLFGNSIPSQIYAGSISAGPGVTKTVTIGGLVSGSVIFQYGAYGAAGANQGGISLVISGYMTASYTYEVHEIDRWSNGGGTGLAISAVTKNASNCTFTIANSHGSYTSGGNYTIIGNDEITVTVS